MKKQEQKIWIGVEDLTNSAEYLASTQEEFAHQSSTTETPLTENQGASRRDFLKYMGFGLGAATLASCEIPVKKAIPYLVKPDEIVPGVANYYTSAYAQSGDFVPVLVKTREGRPIKIEGNPYAPMTEGGTSARAQASVLDLYDTNRTKNAGIIKAEGGNYTLERMDWAELDKAVRGAMGENDEIRIIAHTILSPSLLAAIAKFKEAYPNAKLVQYDPFSSSALLDANQQMYGKRVVPNYRFDKAMCIVSFDADFLGTWISPTEYAKDYIKNRKLRKKDAKGNLVEELKGAETKMSRHIHFESRMSLTGSNADNRVLVKPSEQGAALAALYNAVAQQLGAATISAPAANFAWAKANTGIKKAAEHLVKHRGKSLVVCGVNDLAMQMVVNSLNELLGNYGQTLLWEDASLQRQGSDAEIKKTLDELKAGSVKAVLVLNANPAYDLPSFAAEFGEALAKVPVSVSFNASLDETTALCKYAAPSHHYLESWGDVRPKTGQFYIQQPTIRPLFETRAAGETFLTWADQAEKDNAHFYRDFIKKNWEDNVFKAQNKFQSFQAFWDNALFDGFVSLAKVEAKTETAEPTEGDVLAPRANAGAAEMAAKLPQPKSGSLEVALYETINMGAGQFANNPWLQEMPDPIMRTTWDNFLSVPVAWDGDNDYLSLGQLKDGEIASVSVAGTEYQLPSIRQFGQLNDTVAIGLGYGRTMAGLAGTNVGRDFFPKVGFENGYFNYVTTLDKEPTKIGKDPMFAAVQMHHTYGLKNKMEGSDKEINVDEQVLGHRGFQGSLTNRSVVFQGTAASLDADLEHLKDKRKEYQKLNKKGLYPGHKDWYEMGHHWAMAVDLNACIGCGACTVACMSENNVPVVGKFEVAIAHEMTWLRIDRYYYGTEETPNTVYQPMMCQHCENAPCENVCPVAATNHSSEGLNQMTYNRCIGTRYCANNCPFKVRRFNWLDYTSADLFPANEVDMNRGKQGAEYYTYMTDNLTRMVLNPDVTVRSRGVIEKCSFCVQRIQEGKLKAKVEGRKLKDGDVRSACQQACPTGAIVFGDRNDKNSEVAKLMNTKRAYIPLEETNVGSSVTYLMKVTNKDETFNV